MAQPAAVSAFNAFLALDPDKRKKILERTHPLYQANGESWQVLLDAYEGINGFADGTYLWKYAREEQTDYENRQKQARYHNYAKSLVNLYVRHVMHRGVDRKSEDARLTEWWDDVDGAGTKMSDLMKRAAKLALAMGHDGILVDKTPEAPTGPSRADERARVVASLYMPTAIADWRVVRDELVSAKLKEPVASDDLLVEDEDKKETDACQYLIWSKTDGWLRVNEKGELVGELPANPRLDLVPLAIVRPEPSAAHPFLGQSLLGNPNVFRALFNRCSEEDNVLRDSSWSMLTVSVDKEGDVAEVKKEIGTEVGTTRALIAKGTIDWKGPDQAVPEAIRKAIEYLVQEIYRMAHVTFHRDSRDAESAEALRMKHSELNEMLNGLAQALQKAELEIARYFFAWSEATSLAAQAAFDKAKVSITYPREFFVQDLLEELEVWAEAIALDLGLTFTQRTKLRAAKVLDPDLDAATLKKVEEEINAQPAQATLDAQAQAQSLRDRAAGRVTKAITPPEPQPKPAAA